MAAGRESVAEATSSRSTRASASASVAAKPVGVPEVSTTATLLPAGSLPNKTPANSAARSSRVRLPARSAIRGAVSNTKAAATGPSASGSQPAPRSTGRERANATSRIAAIRNNNSSRWLSRSRRRLRTARSWRNRRAGKRWGTGFRRIRRCSRIGAATRAVPPSSSGERNDNPMAQNRPRRLCRYSTSARSNCMLVSSGT